MFKFGVTTLVLRQFSINKDPSDLPALEIVGRAGGLIAWLLTQMKLNTLTTLKLQGEELSVVYGSLSGETHTVIPVSAIESTQCGHSKTLLYLYLGVIVLALGLTTGDMARILISAIIAAVFFAIYYFSNRMFISVSAGDRTETIAYKKGLVDGASVDLERTLEAIAVINESVLAKHRV